MVRRISRTIFVAQQKIAVRLRAAQVEIAVAQTRFFGGVDIGFDLERWRFCVVQDVQFCGDEFDFAGGDFGIGLLALDDFAFDRDNEFAAHVLGFGVRFGLRFLVENDLDDAGAVADVKEEQIAEVASTMNPAHDDGVAVGVGGTEGAAVMCAF